MIMQVPTKQSPGDYRVCIVDKLWFALIFLFVMIHYHIWWPKLNQIKSKLLSCGHLGCKFSLISFLLLLMGQFLVNDLGLEDIYCLF